MLAMYSSNNNNSSYIAATVPTVQDVGCVGEAYDCISWSLVIGCDDDYGGADE